MSTAGNSEIVYFPDSRVSTIDVGALGLKKHHMAALLEIDVTEAREAFRRIKAVEGQSLSFTAWLAKCISMAVEEHKHSHAFLLNKKSMLVYHDIDISITVEKEYNGSKVPLPYVLRGTNNKSIRELHLEIRRAQQEKSEDGKVVIGRDGSKFLAKLYYSLPGILRRWIWKAFLLKPRAANRNMGSIMLTSVGMYGSCDGWIIPTSIHPLCFAIGTITKKPGVVKEEIAVREYLKMTVLIDHDVMDGAPAARFLSRLEALLRGGWGLDKA